MQEIIKNILSDEITISSSIFKLLLSLVVGAMIGVQRRSKGQAAGMRTFALISMGATLAMIVSIYIPQTYNHFLNGDPGRIAAQVISGVGFLGAGAIIQMKGSVRGLTTAAGIWMTAAIGLSIGAGMFAISILASLVIMFILAHTEQFEKRFVKAGDRKIISLKFARNIQDLDSVTGILNAHDVSVIDTLIRQDLRNRTCTVNLIVLAIGKTDFMNLLSSLGRIADIQSVAISNDIDMGE